MAVGQIVGERQRGRGLTFGGPFFSEGVVGRYRGKRGDGGQACRREQIAARAFLTPRTKCNPSIPARPRSLKNTGDFKGDEQFVHGLKPMLRLCPPRQAYPVCDSFRCFRWRNKNHRSRSTITPQAIFDVDHLFFKGPVWLTGSLAASQVGCLNSRFADDCPDAGGTFDRWCFFL